MRKIEGRFRLAFARWRIVLPSEDAKGRERDKSEARGRVPREQPGTREMLKVKDLGVAGGEPGSVRMNRHLRLNGDKEGRGAT